jgi:hypothetical protein
MTTILTRLSAQDMNVPTIDKVLSTQGYDTAQKRKALYKQIGILLMTPMVSMKSRAEKKKDEISVLCITGPAGNGKSKFAEVLFKAINSISKLCKSELYQDVKRRDDLCHLPAGVGSIICSTNLDVIDRPVNCPVHRFLRLNLSETASTCSTSSIGGREFISDEATRELTDELSRVYRILVA